MSSETPDFWDVVLPVQMSARPWRETGDEQLYPCECPDVSCRIGDCFATCRCILESEPVNGVHLQGRDSVSLTFCSRHVSIDAYVYSYIRELFFPDGVREIKDGCFRGCCQLTRVFFGAHSSLERIGSDAFYESPLVAICVPDSVREIGERSFYGCQGLKAVIFGPLSNLERIGASAFSHTKIADIFLSCRYLGKRCFYGCDHLSRVQFSRSCMLEYIGRECFASSGLWAIVLPTSLTTVCYGAFMNCDLGNRISFEAGRFSLWKDILVDSSTLSVCSHLKKVRVVFVPATVRELGDRCFYRSDYLDCVKFSSGSCVQRAGYKSFSRSSIREVVFPASLRCIDAYCFSECQTVSVKFEKSSQLECIGEFAFENTICAEILIPDNLQDLGDFCFNGCHLSSLKIGRNSKLERIGMGAFRDLVKSFQDICIPRGVMKISRECFYQCLELYVVIFQRDSLLEVLEDRAFCSTRIWELHLPDSVRDIGDECFSFCDNLSHIVFGSKPCLERIGVKAFANCQSLTRVSLKPCRHLRVICAEAFCETGLKEIVISSGVHTIGDGCFSSCSKLYRVNFGAYSSLERLGNRCFSRCANLKHIASCGLRRLRSIGVEAFFETGIEEFCISNSVEELCDRCFYFCRNLARITLGVMPALSSIGVNAFSGTRVKEAKLLANLHELRSKKVMHEDNSCERS